MPASHPDIEADIWGQAWAASTTTGFNVSQLEVHHNLESAGNVVGDPVTVTGNAYVGGNINGQTFALQTVRMKPALTTQGRDGDPHAIACAEKVTTATPARR
jgi:hypothetical protein